MSRARRKHGGGFDDKIVGAIDAKVFREYQSKVLKSVREDLLAGMTADQIFKKYEAHAAAALITSMVNPATVVAAAEKVLDRTQGKPTQKTETTHRLEKLKDSELDAFLSSRLKELEPETDDDNKDVQ